MASQFDADATEQARRIYAARTLHLAEVHNSRVEAAFAAIPREAFLPPPPWIVISRGVATGTMDVEDLYQDVLVALDRERGINNGEPALHAAWLATVDPQPGETVLHVGSGTGYYTAMLATLVAPGGQVIAFEIQEPLARAAAGNLQSYADVSVVNESAFGRVLPTAHVVYVNAGVVAPDPEWLRALRPGGRLIFPWQPWSNWGHAVLVMRTPKGFRASSIMSVGFIACGGETTTVMKGGAPTEGGVASTRSVWLTSERPPDESATAIYDAVWFSREEVE